MIEHDNLSGLSDRASAALQSVCTMLNALAGYCMQAGGPAGSLVRGVELDGITLPS